MSRLLAYTETTIAPDDAQVFVGGGEPPDPCRRERFLVQFWRADAG